MMRLFKWVDYMNIELPDRIIDMYRRDEQDINKIRIPFVRDVSERSDISQVEIPHVRYVSDEELYFDHLNRQNLERYILSWNLRHQHARYYNAYYRNVWNIPQPPDPGSAWGRRASPSLPNYAPVIWANT